MTIQDQAEGPGRIAAIRHRIGFLDVVGGWLLIVSLLTSFIVMAEPAPTDVAYLCAALCVAFGLRLSMPRAAVLYAAIAYVFLLSNSISGAECVNPGQCTMYIFITFYLVSIPILMVHFSMTFGMPFVRRMYTAFFIAIVISALTGVLARAGVLPGPSYLFFREDEGLRLSPFFKDPNVYGPFMVAGLMLYLGHVVSGARPLLRGGAVLALIWIPLFLAFSRAAWLAAAISLLIFVVLGYGFLRASLPVRRLSTLILGSIGLLVPLSVVILVEFNLLWFFQRRLGLQSYDTERFSAHSEAIGVALDNPLGIGPGRFVGQTKLPGSEFALATHNVFLKVWAENGWLGIASFLGLFGVVLWGLGRLILRPTGRLPIHIALVACLVGMLVNGWFIDTLHWRHMFVVLGFGLVEIAVAEQLAPGGQPPGRAA